MLFGEEAVLKTISFYITLGHRTALYTAFLIALYCNVRNSKNTVQKGEEAAISYHGSNNQITNTAVLNQI